MRNIQLLFGYAMMLHVWREDFTCPIYGIFFLLTYFEISKCALSEKTLFFKKFLLLYQVLLIFSWLPMIAGLDFLCVASPYEKHAKGNYKDVSKSGNGDVSIIPRLGLYYRTHQYYSWLSVRHDDALGFACLMLPASTSSA